MIEWRQAELIGGAKCFFTDTHAVIISNYIDRIELKFCVNENDVWRIDKKEILDAKKIKEDFELLCEEG